MKNMKRAYRRYKKEVHLKRRARNYYDWSYSLSIHKESCWAEFKESVEFGESYTWMRSTGKPCSCNMCSHNKYSRLPKSDVKKIIKNQLE